jgi:hypothetical protein
MVCHDSPAAVVHSFPRPPAEWSPADLRRNDAHRARLQRITDGIRPRYLCTATARAYQRDCNFGFGPVQITGLAADGTLANFAVLDVASMVWEPSRRGLLSRKTFVSRRAIATATPRQRPAC